MAEEESVAGLWDIHKIQQIYLTYAVSMDSHQWDLMDQCFWEDAEIKLGALGRAVSGGDAASIGVKGWQKICRETDATFDAIQHFMYQPLIKIENNIARVRVYYVAQHVLNALAPACFFVSGGWYNGDLEKRDGEWRIISQIAVSSWYAGNPAVVLGQSLPLGGLARGPDHGSPAWLLNGSNPFSAREVFA